MLLEVALFLRAQAGGKRAPKVGSVVKNFLENTLFAEINLNETGGSEQRRKAPPRVWPESAKDKAIRLRKEAHE